MIEISIIVPIYNAQKYLSRCIESVIKQTYKNFELILIDDGSTDNSYAICEEYQKKDNRIILIKKENGGQSSARNNGLNIARGNYIGFVDSDDWISSNMFEKLFSLIESYEADIVSSDYFFSNNDIEVFPEVSGKELVLNNKTEIIKYFFKSDKLNSTNEFAVWGKLYKRELFNNLFFKEGIIYEDYLLNFYLFEKANKIVKTKDILYAYFQSPNSTTRAKLDSKQMALLSTTNEIIENLIKYDENIQNLGQRKLAMVYFSLLARYVRYGTEFSNFEITKLVDELYSRRKYLLCGDFPTKIKILTFGMITNVRLMRQLYKLFNK